MRFIISAIVVMVLLQGAHAQEFPRQADLCIDGTVSKQKLAKAFLRFEQPWLDLYLASVDSDNIKAGRPQWQRIFTDAGFCSGNSGCLGPDPNFKAVGNEKPPQNTKLAEMTLVDLRRAFTNAIGKNTNPGKTYRLSGPSAGPDFFIDPRTQILCLPNEPVAEEKVTSIELPVRLRAGSDDLNIKSTQPAFKAVKPATITYTKDGSDQKTSTVALQATIGYPIPLSPLLESYFKSGELKSFDGELIPYISATQSIRKVDGKPSTFTEANNVAVGGLLSFDAVFGAFPTVDNYVMVKPQYLWNTYDKSEIASLRLYYQPWTSRIPAINKPFPIPSAFAITDDAKLTLLFDLRSDIGQYTNVGVDPLTATNHTSFYRVGSHFGVAATSTVDKRSGSHLVLSVTETMLYGLYGSTRQLNLFDTALSYYFDDTSNFAITINYTKGQDEDTAERVQRFTAGLSAKF